MPRRCGCCSAVSGDPGIHDRPARRAACSPTSLTANRVPRLLGELHLPRRVVRHRDRSAGEPAPPAAPASCTCSRGTSPTPPSAATVVSGILLLLLGHALKRRKAGRGARPSGWSQSPCVLHVVKVEPPSRGCSRRWRWRCSWSTARSSTPWATPPRAGRPRSSGRPCWRSRWSPGFATIWLNRKDIRGGWPPLHHGSEEIAGAGRRHRTIGLYPRPVQRHRRRGPARPGHHDRLHDHLPGAAAAGAPTGAHRATRTSGCVSCWPGIPTLWRTSTLRRDKRWSGRPRASPRSPTASCPA